MAQVPMTILRAHQMEHQALHSAGMAGFPVPARNFPTKPTRGTRSLHGLGDVYGLNFLGDTTSQQAQVVTRDVLDQELNKMAIYSAIGGVVLVAVGGVITYFVTRR